MHDKDKDGKLNAREREEALRSLHGGIEKNFVWGDEQAGAQRPYRLIQKRGQIVDAEDFHAIRGTYPEHPLTERKPAALSATTLKEARKAELVEKLNDAKRKWDAANPSEVPLQFSQSEFLIEKPAHLSRTHIAEEKKRNLRLKAGLSAEFEDVKQNKPPSLAYLEMPQTLTQAQLKQARKNELVAILSNSNPLDSVIDSGVCSKVRIAPGPKDPR